MPLIDVDSGLKSSDGDSAGGMPTPEPAFNAVQLEGNSDGISSTLKIDLNSYITSYKEDDEASFLAHRNAIEEMVSGVLGGDLWTQMLNAALDNAVEHGRLSTSARRVIEESPACAFMVSSFVEIVKNLMDEAILGHYESGKNPKLELSLSIDISSPDRIGLTIADNGRGFPPAFLEKNSTPAGRDAYILEVGSKKPNYDKSLPTLFGGAGLGLRILMAEVLYGDALTGPGRLKPKYQKPLISEISLGKSDHSSGALIQITTSKTPLKERVVETHHAPAIQLSMPPKKPKKQPTATPDSSSAGSTSTAKNIKEEVTELRRSQEAADQRSGTQPK